MTNVLLGKMEQTTLDVVLALQQLPILMATATK